jgi:ABC-2 family transporter protein
MGAIRAVFEVARQTAALQLQNRLFRLLVLAVLGGAALAFFVGMNPPHGLTGRNLFSLISWWMFANVLMPWTTMYFGVQAVHGDVEDRTFQYLFLRPIPRWSIYVGKVIAVAGMSAVVHAFGMALVFGAAAYHPDLWTDGIETELLSVFCIACVLLGVAYATVAGLLAAWFKRPLVWSAVFIVFGQVFLANLPAKAGIRLATIVDPVRRFVLDALDIEAGDRFSRMLWPSERNFSAEMIGEPLVDLSLFVCTALALGVWAYGRAEYDSRERE